MAAQVSQVAVRETELVIDEKRHRIGLHLARPLADLFDLAGDAAADVEITGRSEDSNAVICLEIQSLQGQRDSNGKRLVDVEGEGLGNFDQQPSKLPVFSG